MAKPMLDGKLMFPTQYLASEEFLEKDVTLTIKGVKIDNLQMSDGGTEDKPVVMFEKTDKKLVLNKTNATTIAKLYGSEARGWAGKAITLYPTECQAFGKTVDCIRIRSKAPKSKPSPEPEAAPAEPVSAADAGPEQPASGSGSDFKQSLSLVRIRVKTEDFSLESYRDTKQIYLDAGLVWNKRWDDLVQTKEWHTIIKAMYEGLKEVEA